MALRSSSRRTCNCVLAKLDKRFRLDDHPVCGLAVFTRRCRRRVGQHSLGDDDIVAELMAVGDDVGGGHRRRVELVQLRARGTDLDQQLGLGTR